jgi:hypothetical protein
MYQCWMRWQRNYEQEFGRRQSWPTTTTTTTTTTSSAFALRVESRQESSFTIRNCSVTYLITLWCRILFEKLIVTQLVKKIPLSYGTRRFITVFTKARHRTLSWASRIQFAPSIPISPRSILMLSSHLRLGPPSGLLPPVTSRILGKTAKRTSHTSTCNGPADSVSGRFSWLFFIYPEHVCR